MGRLLRGWWRAELGLHVRTFPAWFLCLVSTVSGLTAGYLFAALRSENPVCLSAHSTPALEDLQTRKSFSEADNARSVLRALATRYLIELRQQRYAVGLLTRVHQTPDAALRQQRLEGAVNDLQHAIADFAGTGQELLLVQDLLILLKTQGRHEQWLEMYLRVLYEHPTENLVGERAEDAMIIARELGCEAKLRLALRHVVEIPFAFPSKTQAARVLAEVTQARHNVAAMAHSITVADSAQAWPQQP